MTEKRKDRTAAVELSKQSRSNAYKKAKCGRSALPASMVDPNQLGFSGSGFDVDTSREAPDWYFQIEALLQRHFGFGESLEQCAKDILASTKGLEDPIEVANRIVLQLKTISDQKVGLKFQLATKSNEKFPRKPQARWVNEFAKRISNRIEALCVFDPHFVQEVLSFYSQHVQKTNWIVMTNESQAPAIRQFISFVRKLKIERLRIDIVGFVVKGCKGTHEKNLKLLGLNSHTPIRSVNARNQNSFSALRHLAIDVVCDAPEGNDTKQKSSEAFRYAVVLATIFQVWSLPEANSDAEPRAHAARSIATAEMADLEQASLF